MSNKTTTLILGWIFLVSTFISNYDVNIICASIFFAVNFIIETIEKVNKEL